jgi:Homeobox KN domain
VKFKIDVFCNTRRTTHHLQSIPSSSHPSTVAYPYTLQEMPRRPSDAVAVITAWLLSDEHKDFPYPTPEEIEELVAQTGIERKQLKLLIKTHRNRLCPDAVAANKAKQLATTAILKDWITSPEHNHHPYPTRQEKAELMKQTGFSEAQLKSWFNDNRQKYCPPEALKSTLLPAKAVAVFTAWVAIPAHKRNPFPTEAEKERLALEAGVDVKQVENWFKHYRKKDRTNAAKLIENSSPAPSLKEPPTAFPVQAPEDPSEPIKAPEDLISPVEPTAFPIEAREDKLW